MFDAVYDNRISRHYHVAPTPLHNSKDKNNYDNLPKLYTLNAICTDYIHYFFLNKDFVGVQAYASENLRNT